MIRSLFLFFALACFPSPALADWYKASSDHFVIYAEDSEKDIRRFAESLERYHKAMEFLTQRKSEKPSPSNRVTVFVVGSQRDIRELAGTDSRYIAGFYTPRAGGSKAFVQDITWNRKETSFSMIVLLHEYAHHFLISSSPFAMPRWLNEGSAEFFASAAFDNDGSVSIGRPAQHRGYELFNEKDVSVDELLDYSLYEKRKGKRYDAFYGRSWLLFHYLHFNEERKGQLARYQREIIEGANPVDAARTAFGDFEQLQKDIDRYLKQRRMMSYTLKPEWLPIGDITVTALSDGEAEMMPVRIRSQRGVDEELAQEILAEAREIAARYAGDPGVMTALAEAEFDAGNDDLAIAAADKAISVDPARANAYVQKGYALFRKAEDAADYEQAMKLAMAPFAALNKLENDHPMPLIYYYRSFTNRGAEPSETARHALERAAQLAPFDKGLWLDVAFMQAQEGKIALARASLQPIVNDPHGGRRAKQVALFLKALEGAEEGVPFRTMPILDGPDLPEDEGE